MPPSILSFTVVAAIVTTFGTLLGHVLKEVVLARSFEDWKHRRALDALYRKYRDPLLLSAVELSNRLIEILEEHPADFLTLNVLSGQSPEPSHDAERDHYFLRYKYQSTVYRLAAFLAWLELYRQDLVFLDPPSTGVTGVLQGHIQDIRGDLADGHLNTASDWINYADALIFREEQRALGETMIGTVGGVRSVIGYGAFVAILESPTSPSHRWLKTAINFLAEPGAHSQDFRLERYRRLLIHLFALVQTADPARASARLRTMAAKYGKISSNDLVKPLVPAV
jgi:hypothetical protein